MRLLVLTQKVDHDDDLLGFFHGWLQKFSGHFERITAIGLEVGRYDLPENVTVFSLGKKTGASRLTYLVRFYAYAWRERKKYDIVFVHMNKEYVLLGWLLWKVLGKKIILWYNHKHGNILAAAAVALADIVLSVSDQSYPARRRKAILMPAGVDTDLFRRDETIARDKTLVLYVGRISPVKRIDLIIRALREADARGLSFRVEFYGEPTPADRAYASAVEKDAADLIQSGRVVFRGSSANREMPAVYNQADISLNATPAGSFDKTILEAMACEEIVLLSNYSLAGKIPDECIFNDEHDLVRKLEYALSLNKEARRSYGKMLRTYVQKEHSLGALVERLMALIQKL